MTADDNNEAEGIEQARLAALRRYAILDTPPEPEFDRIVQITARALNARIVIISLVDRYRIWFKAKVGLTIPELPRAESLCAHVVVTGRFFELTDSRQGLPAGLVPPAGTRAYAGMPLMTPDGFCLGTLCVLDAGPRAGLTQEDRSVLGHLAAMTMAELELRRQRMLQARTSQRLALINDILAGVGGAAGFIPAIEAALLRLCHHTGAAFGHLWDMTRGGPVRLLGIAAISPALEPLREIALSVFDATAAQSDLDSLFTRGGAYLAPDVSEASVAAVPLLAKSYELGMRAFVVLPFSVGARRHAFLFKFAEPRGDLDEVAALLAEVAQTIRPALQRKQAEDRLALLNDVLAVSSSAGGFVAAAEATMQRLVRDVGAMFGMLWARSADGRSIRLAGISTDAALGDDWARSAAAAFPIPVRKSMLNGLLLAGDRASVERIDDAAAGRSPLLAFGRVYGLRSLAASALTVGDQRFILVFGFATERRDLALVTDLLCDVGQAIRPALQRKQAEDELALMNAVLSCVGEAESFPAAVEGALALLCERLDGLYAMLWSRSEDARWIRMVGMAGSAGIDPEFRPRVEEQFPFPTDKGLLSDLFERDGCIALGQIPAEVRDQFPLTAAAYRYGMRSFVALSVPVGQRRYILIFTFATERTDLERVTALMTEVARAIRPTLQRKQAQDRLTLLQAAVDATADAVAIADAAGPTSGDMRVLYCNPAFTAMMGYTQDEMRDQPIRILRGIGTDPAAIAVLDRTLTDCVPSRVEILNYRRDGTEIWLDLSTTPIAGDYGEAVTWVGVMRDITRQRADRQALRRLTESLRERSRELADVATMARIGSWRWKVREQQFDWADETCALFGVARDTVDTSLAGFLALLHLDDRDAAAAAIAVSVRTGRPLTSEARVPMPNGRRRILLWNAEPVRDAHGEVAELRGYCQDVTERRDAEAALRHGEKLRTLGELTGGIAHEFSNLMTVILANLDLSLDNRGSLDLTRNELEASRKAAISGANLTRRLLSYARAEPLRRESTDLGAFLRPLRDMARPILGMRYSLALRPDPSVPPCPVDRSQLEAAVLNLILNARDAMPQGGEIGLFTEMLPIGADPAHAAQGLRPGPHAVVAVRDFGTGMSREVLERAFEPFFTTKAAGSGSGLGLSTVLSFARHSGGGVLIDSVAGTGTTVRIVLPLDVSAVA